jgi:hypothetical protein
MKGLGRASAAVWWLFVLVNFTACLPGDRARFSRIEAIEHFDRNRAEFGRIASNWLQDYLQDSFYYRPWAKDVRWNATVIGLPVKDGKVKVMHGTSTEFLSFDIAAERAAVRSSVLLDWIGRAKRLSIAGIAVIGVRRSEQNRYLQIDLQEGGAHYGCATWELGYKTYRQDG